VNICNFRVESTTIRRLVIICPEVRDDEWEVNCPNLVDLEMQHHTPPVENLQRALVNCPRIETFFSHKYLNKEPLLTIYLPNCIKY